ncbi:hypothetical protein HispidOSU_024869, partial [Sigmodon hispidus]
ENEQLDLVIGTMIHFLKSKASRKGLFTTKQYCFTELPLQGLSELACQGAGQQTFISSPHCEEGMLHGEARRSDQTHFAVLSH